MIFIQETAFETVVCKMVDIVSRPHYVKRIHAMCLQ